MARSKRISDIAEVKARGLDPGHRYNVAISHLRDLRDGIAQLDELLDSDLVEWREYADCDELYRGVPVLVTATIESYFRTLFAELIESGPPFRQRATAIKDVKLDVESLVLMEGQSVTLGDLVAHSLSLNQPGDLQSAYQMIAGEDLWTRAAEVWAFATGPTLFPAVPADIRSYLLRNLDQLYRTRHIVSHEARTNVDVDAATARGLCNTAMEFLVVVDFLADSLMRGTARDRGPA